MLAWDCLAHPGNEEFTSYGDNALTQPCWVMHGCWNWNCLVMIIMPTVFQATVLLLLFSAKFCQLFFSLVLIRRSRSSLPKWT